MKRIKLFLTLALAAAVTTASAQFANADASSSKSSKGGSALVKDTNPYNRFYVSVNPMTFKFDVKGADDLKMTGLAVGYLHGFSLSNNLPLFLEAGANLTYAFGKQEIEGYTDKYNLFSVNVPVNVAYKLTFGKSDFSLTPFIGINLRYNISGKQKWDDEGYDYGDWNNWGDWGDFYGYGATRSESVNLFDDAQDKMGDSAWKHFQVGWQIGVGFNYKKLYVGVSYGSDFSEIAKKMKGRTTQISLGLNF